MEVNPRPDDAADALAVAWCHLTSRKFPEVFERHETIHEKCGTPFIEASFEGL